jgi:ribosomal-protein-alanine N-acetyltransferase
MSSGSDKSAPAAPEPGPRAEVLIRPAEPGDLDQMMELEDSAFGAEAWSRSMVAAELDGPWRCYLVAQAGDRVEGYAGVFMGVDAAEVMTIAVSPRARRQGIGRRLMRALIAKAMAAGTRAVTLEVAVDSLPAISLYRSFGFEEIGRRRGYYQPSGRDALVMRLLLGNPERSGR